MASNKHQRWCCGAPVVACVAFALVLLASGTSGQMYKPTNIYQAIADIPEFSYFTGILGKSGLKDRLIDPSFVGTVFAPINPAFVNLSKIMDVPVGKLLENPGMMTIAAYHIVPGAAYSVSPFNGQPLQHDQKLLTIEGSPLTVDKILSRGFTLVKGDNNYASIIQADIKAGQAILQVIDAVLIPTVNGTTSPKARRTRTAADDVTDDETNL